ncbi:hypothetical protein AZI85_10160 [Bdellovibrio bacteriovorus]|uniref:Isochorismatase-like domain-containing protein n=1 Tax=Bdellovibrio bacteriovorus TaxID=959 RepID=A0A150WEG8_BDEBC|nr:isochorismatase family protein [Bdellovibrio bacteriovorus]KYG61290.1 hypothetical protein AZI85_10160 [Bdellovibrio bacteriovorus]
MKKALLVIDLQVCYLKMNATEDAAMKAISKVNQLTEKAMKEDFEIFYIQHFFDKGPEKWVLKWFFKGAGLRSDPNAIFDPRLEIRNSQILQKNTENTFLSTDLHRILQEKGINEIHIVGQDGTACIQATAYGALKLGYSVKIVDEAILSGSPKKWAKIKADLITRPHCELI